MQSGVIGVSKERRLLDGSRLLTCFLLGPLQIGGISPCCTDANARLCEPPRVRDCVSGTLAASGAGSRCGCSVRGAMGAVNVCGRADMSSGRSDDCSDKAGTGSLGVSDFLYAGGLSEGRDLRGDIKGARGHGSVVGGSGCWSLRASPGIICKRICIDLKLVISAAAERPQSFENRDVFALESFLTHSSNLVSSGLG